MNQKDKIAVIQMKFIGLLDKVEEANFTGVLFDEREMKLLEDKMIEIKSMLDEVYYE